MADPFISLTLQERREVLESAFGRGLTPSTALLEKDVWVVWTLQALFAAPFADDLVFKGGTSLSKAYNIIQRFSEDVDLTYDIRKLADEQAGHPEGLTDAEARSLGRRIREKLLPRLLEAEIQPYLQAQIGAAGLPATVEREDENLIVVYETAAEYPAYIRPRVKLEFGARSTGEPATPRPVSCDLALAFPELEFPSATPRVMRAERTFWEKATLAHVYCLEASCGARRDSRATGTIFPGWIPPVSPRPPSRIATWPRRSLITRPSSFPQRMRRTRPSTTTPRSADTSSWSRRRRPSAS